MSFEDVELLKDNFTLYDVPAKASVSKSVIVVRKKDTTFTRIVVTAPVFGVKYHFKMLALSVFSKLKLKRV
jgi:hypothetical protein